MGFEACWVVKVGGSLLDLSELGNRLWALVEDERSGPVLMVVGGGPAADHVRRFDRSHGLGDEAGHWHAVRAMQMNAYMIADIMRRSGPVAMVADIACFQEASSGEGKDGVLIVDPLRWLEVEQQRGVVVPKDWGFTSDSIAAHIATRVAAKRLTLLKSILPPEGCDMGGAFASGLVDVHFETASASIAHVDLINLRASPAERAVLRARF